MTSKTSFFSPKSVPDTPKEEEITGGVLYIIYPLSSTYNDESTMNVGRTPMEPPV
jgi:hypothetical protein